MNSVISEALGELVELAVRRVPQGPRMVAIDGAAGSGKTSIAAHLAGMLGGQQYCVVVHMDDVYAGWDGLAGAPSLLEEQVLAPLGRGEPGRFHRWDWHQRRRGDEVVVPRRDWVIVEGVGSGSRICRPHLAALLFLEADEVVRKERGVERDGESFLSLWDGWARQEAALFSAEQTRRHADLIIRT